MKELSLFLLVLAIYVGTGNGSEPAATQKALNILSGLLLLAAALTYFKSLVDAA